MSIEQQNEIKNLKERVATVERLESTLYDTLDKLLDRVAVLEGKKTLTLPEKKRA